MDPTSLLLNLELNFMSVANFAPLPLYECYICMEEFERVASCSACTWTVCGPCFKNYLAQSVQDRNPTIGCPSCRQPIQDSTLKRHLPAEIYAIFLRQNLDFACPVCQGLCDKRGWSKRQAYCAKCKLKWCMVCHHRHHLLGKCAKIAEEAAVEEDEAFRRWRTAHDVQNCPKCKRCIEKDGGCRRMKCTKCQHEFCWQCRAVWPGYHHKC
ncbi:hypothetical protein LEN26_016583 [Aphanomyces euteiches]|nr:hypothetical protein LEN26_016583 [Aphanomyces euteiches]KAH9108602.1 hypothetical protein AeMF1_016229 [Aphanomyces euteiches]KAH9188040.1 hypothetical protein AeNC1_009981 [Aphanomyces euteiches]